MSKAQEIIARKDKAYSDLFNSPEGKLVLEDLIVMFAPENLATDTAHSTAIRVGQSNPIRYIQRRIKDGMEGKSL
jgi:hypothetical protein